MNDACPSIQLRGQNLNDTSVEWGGRALEIYRLEIPKKPLFVIAIGSEPIFFTSQEVVHIHANFNSMKNCLGR